MPLEEEHGIARLPDGGHLAYCLRGAGPELLLHRPLGGSMALWGDFAGALAPHFRVIAFDPRGVGGSSDVPPSHSTRAMALDALALLDRLRVGRAHVFGLSLGGMVASWQAILAPGRVHRLVLASTLPDAEALSRHGVVRLAGMARCFLHGGDAAEVCLVRSILSPTFLEAHPRRMAEIERTVRRIPARRENLFRLALAAARHHAAAGLRRSHTETLLLFGALDPFVSRYGEIELLRDCPRARLELVKGAGHDLTLEAPLETAERVIAFLSDSAPAAAGQSDGLSGH